MPYVKHEGIEIELNVNNVYEKCARCGNEFQIDLDVASIDVDFGILCYPYTCSECDKHSDAW